MPSTVLRFGQARLVPAYNPEDAIQVPVAMAAGSYAFGTVIGQITAANVNAVHTITSTLTGGSFRLFLPWPGLNVFTGNIAYNVTGATYATNIQTAVNAAVQAVFPTGAVVVTGTGPFTLTYSGGVLAGQPLALPVVDNTLATGGTASIASTTTGVGPNGDYRAYASGNTDGSQAATGLLEYQITVDVAGNVWLGTVAGASEFGGPDIYTTQYINGNFDYADLTGLDATSLSGLNGHFINGSIAAGKGVIHIG